MKLVAGTMFANLIRCDIVQVVEFAWIFSEEAGNAYLSNL